MMLRPLEVPRLVNLGLAGTAISTAPTPSRDLGGFLHRGKQAAEVEAASALVTSGAEYEINQGQGLGQLKMFERALMY